MKNKNRFSICHAYDSVFKSHMQDLNVARDVPEAHLPSDTLKDIDLKTLRLESSDFIDDKLKQSQCDVLFSLETNMGKGYAYILREYQSTADPMLAFRLLEYAVQIMDRHRLKGHQTLPVVIQVVVYAGKVTPYPR